LAAGKALSINIYILLFVGSAHLGALWLSAREMPYYALQLLPEAAVVAAIVLAYAASGGNLSGTAPVRNPWRATGAVLAAVALMLLVPMAREVQYVAARVRAAQAGGYLAQASNFLPARMKW